MGLPDAGAARRGEDCVKTGQPYPPSTFPHYPHHRRSLSTTHFGPAAKAILFVFMHYPLMPDRWRRRPEEIQSAAQEEGAGFFFCVLTIIGYPVTPNAYNMVE